MTAGRAVALVWATAAAVWAAAALTGPALPWLAAFWTVALVCRAVSVWAWTA